MLLGLYHFFEYLLFILAFPFLCFSRCHLDMSTFELGTMEHRKLAGRVGEEKLQCAMYQNAL